MVRVRSACRKERECLAGFLQSLLHFFPAVVRLVLLLLLLLYTPGPLSSLPRRTSRTSGSTTSSISHIGSSGGRGRGCEDRRQSRSRTAKTGVGMTPRRKRDHLGNATLTRLTLQTRGCCVNKCEYKSRYRWHNNSSNSPRRTQKWKSIRETHVAPGLLGINERSASRAGTDMPLLPYSSGC